MLNPDKKAINIGAVEQLNLDLLQCESKIYLLGKYLPFSILMCSINKNFKIAFASSININGLDNEIILLCFAEIRQVRFLNKTNLNRNF
jgi:hypothetical protein